MAVWPDRIFCDTSFFFACLEGRDANHPAALGRLEQSARRPSAFWTTWEVISETVTLLRRQSGYGTAHFAGVCLTNDYLDFWSRRRGRPCHGMSKRSPAEVLLGTNA